MPPDPTGLELSQPVAWYRRKFQPDLKNLLKAGAKTAISGVAASFTMRFDATAKEFTEVVASLGLQERKEHKAYFLIFVCLERAMGQVLMDYAQRYDWRLDAEARAALGAHIHEMLGEEKIVLHGDFFENPDRLSLIKSLDRALRTWLIEKGRTPIQARELTLNLPRRFVIEFWEEWNRNGDRYAEVWQHFKGNPATPYFLQARLEAAKQEKLIERLRQGAFQRYQELRGRGGRYEHLDIAEVLLTAVQSQSGLVETQVQLAGETLGKRASVEKLWPAPIPHSIILGDGGMGKTVSLLRLWESFLGDETEGPIPVFVQLNEFNQAQDQQKGQWLTWYLARHYLGERPLTESTEGQLWQWLEADWDRPYPKVILLLDGFNEITADQTPLLTALQQEWRGKARHIQLLLSSRYGNNFTWARDFNTLELQPLAEKTAHAYLESRSLPWPPEDQPDMRRLLTNPMMLTLYAATSEVIAQEGSQPGVQFKPTASTGELMWNFLQAQVLNYAKQFPTNPDACAYHRWLLWHLLPAIGYEMEQRGLFEFTRKQLREAIRTYLKQAATQTDNWIEAFPACEGVWEQLEEADTSGLFGFKKLQQILCSQLRMLKKEGTTYTFLHQNFRDFFAALHLRHQIQLDISQHRLPQVLKPRVLSLYLRRMLGEMEGEHHNAARLEDRHWTISHQTPTLFTRALDCCRSQQGEAARGLAIFNLLEIIYEVRGEWTGLSLHHLDLALIRLNRRLNRLL